MNGEGGPMFVDSHCHLDLLERKGQAPQAVVARARAAGIGLAVTICTRLSEADGILALAESFPDVWCSIGVHPHEAETEEVTLDRLLALASHPRVVGIGETGLDYYYEHSPRQAQQESFILHIEAARRTGLPLIVHTRDADEDTLAILRREYAASPFTGLIHCFGGSREFARAVTDIGFYISLSGIVTFRNAGDLRETVRGLPRDRILLETDAPYLAPVPCRGKVNEPALLPHTATMVASLHGLTVPQLAEITTANFFRLFTRASRAEKAPGNA